ncbi:MULTISPECIES: N-acetylmuramoyl-L-alanine amidase family protein [Henriciella]|uniref:N-acetylmuramoyl-L-alanine amidase family protein n=1 Tax=Henriciella TaxID=453849 RepID=UPI003510F7B7
MSYGVQVIPALRFFIAVWAAILAAACCHAAQISAIEVTGDTEHTRITLIASEPVEHGSFLAQAGGLAQIEVMTPGSLVLPNAATPPPGGAVNSYEIRDDEIIFNLMTPMMVSRTLDLSPTTVEPNHRLVIDLVRVAPVRFQRAAAAQADNKAAYRAKMARALAQHNGVPPEAARPDQYVIVIDPGHGGKDPGASSHNQRREKAIVLSTSLKLKAILEQNPRYKVHLTRENDVYVEHEDRVSMARNWGADLFISVHADAAGNPGVSGATVYTLSSRGERRVDGTARTNGWDLPIEDGTPVEVSGILADLIKRETKSNSSIFAEMLIPELAKAGPIVRNSHRQENFFVLLAPDVPAVLVEIGFLTNRSDVARLSSDSGQGKAADAIANAIDQYFEQRDLLYAAN